MNKRRRNVLVVLDERGQEAVAKLIYLEILVAEVLRRYNPEVEVSDVAGVIDPLLLLSRTNAAVREHLIDPRQLQALEFAGYAFCEFRRKRVLSCPEDPRLNDMIATLTVAISKMKEAFARGNVTV